MISLSPKEAHADSRADLPAYPGVPDTSIWIFGSSSVSSSKI